MMNYDEFKDQVVEHIKEHLPMRLLLFPECAYEVHGYAGVLLIEIFTKREEKHRTFTGFMLYCYQYELWLMIGKDY